MVPGAESNHRHEDFQLSAQVELIILGWPQTYDFASFPRDVAILACLLRSGQFQNTPGKFTHELHKRCRVVLEVFPVLQSIHCLHVELCHKEVDRRFIAQLTNDVLVRERAFETLGMTWVYGLAPVDTCQNGTPCENKLV